MEDSIQLEDKTFVKYISASELECIVDRLATELNEYYTKFQLEIILVGILDGSFIFMADLVRKLTFPHKIHFVKLKSYQDMESTGQVEVLLDLDVEVDGKHILIVEDIVDTGLTLEAFKGRLNKSNPLSVKLCTLLSKPEVHNDIVELDFVGKEIPPEFIVGYGLDLNGIARNLPDIYKLKI